MEKLINERKMLERAAKVAGYIPQEFLNNENYMDGFLEQWKPLENGEDSLRLAVDMGYVNPACWPNPSHFVHVHGMDWLTATKYAVCFKAALAWKGN